MVVHPWDGVFAPDELKAFVGFADADRPLEAGSRPALIIVDMVESMVDSRSSIGWGDTGTPAVETNRTLLLGAREAQIPIFFTTQYAVREYKPSPSEYGRWKHRSRYIGGDTFLPNLMPGAGEIVVYKKGKPSGFFGTDLAAMLIYERVDTVIVTGMTTSGCVRATIVDAFSYNYHVLIPHECVADRSQLSHKVSLFEMHMKYADVVSLELTLKYIKSLPNAAHSAERAGSTKRGQTLASSGLA